MNRRRGPERYSPAEVARVCHAANAALQEVQNAYGDTVPSGPWFAELPERQEIVTDAITDARERGITQKGRSGALLLAPVRLIGAEPDEETVIQFRSGKTPRQHHNDWADRMRQLGWTRGPHDPAARTHPNICGWDELDQAQQDKDRLFLAIVVAMTLTD